MSSAKSNARVQNYFIEIILKKKNKQKLIKTSHLVLYIFRNIRQIFVNVSMNCMHLVCGQCVSTEFRWENHSLSASMKM